LSSEKEKKPPPKGGQRRYLRVTQSLGEEGRNRATEASKGILKQLQQDSEDDKGDAS